MSTPRLQAPSSRRSTDKGHRRLPQSCEVQAAVDKPEVANSTQWEPGCCPDSEGPQSPLVITPSPAFFRHALAG